MPHLPNGGSDQYGDLDDRPPYRPSIGSFARITKSSLDFAHVPLFPLDILDLLVEVAQFRHNGRYVRNVGSALSPSP